MGWQARLPKNKKEKFVKSCNKCNGTGVKEKYVSVAGIAGTEEIVKCKCMGTAKPTQGLSGGRNKYPNP